MNPIMMKVYQAAGGEGGEHSSQRLAPDVQSCVPVEEGGGCGAQGLGGGRRHGRAALSGSTCPGRHAEPLP